MSSFEAFKNSYKNPEKEEKLREAKQEVEKVMKQSLYNPSSLENWSEFKQERPFQKLFERSKEQREKKRGEEKEERVQKMLREIERVKFLQALARK